MSATGVLIVRNMHGGPTVFTHEHDGIKTPYEWFGAGDPDERDVLEVPESMGINPNFRKAVARGMLKIEDGDDDIVDSINRAGSRWQERQLERRQETEAMMQRENANDMIILACVGPGPRGTECGASVFVRERIQKTNPKPPLCDAHKHLSNTFALTETNEIRDGKPVMAWTQAGKTAPNAVPAT